MSQFQPLSVRRGLRPPRGPYEGVPAHLTYQLRDWLQFAWANTPSYDLNSTLLNTAAILGIELSSHGAVDIRSQILIACADEDVFLDVVDLTLRLNGWARQEASALRGRLEAGGSVWTISEDDSSLQRRVDATATASYSAATTPTDEASAELREAWSSIYGRNPDPSDAWDHAIKAVEAVLVPIVEPRNQRATLGSVLSRLAANPGAYTLGLQTSHRTINGVATLEAMLRLMWPNPDRHGGAGPGRTPHRRKPRRSSSWPSRSCSGHAPGSSRASPDKVDRYRR